MFLSFKNISIIVGTFYHFISLIQTILQRKRFKNHVGKIKNTKKSSHTQIFFFYQKNAKHVINVLSILNYTFMYTAGKMCKIKKNKI